MSTRRSSLGDTGNGRHPLARIPKRFRSLAVVAVACLVLANVAYARKGERNHRGAAAQSPPAATAAPALPAMLTKTMALDAVIEALAMNQQRGRGENSRAGRHR